MDSNIKNEVVTIQNFFWLFCKTSCLLFWNLLLLFYYVIRSIFDGLLLILSFIVRWLGPVNGAVFEQLNTRELYRSIALAASSGTGIAGTLDIMNDHMEEFVKDPALSGFLRAIINGLEYNYAAVTIAITILIADLVRRTYQGHKQIGMDKHEILEDKR